MASLNDLIKLIKSDPGKCFIMDEQGEVQLVLMSMQDYQHLLLEKLQEQVADVEQINQKIISIQLHEPVSDSAIQTPRPPKPPKVDLREEVIDPSFNFDALPEDTL
jgi:hypothetical protein